jgi:hexosaminidase
MPNRKVRLWQKVAMDIPITGIDEKNDIGLIPKPVKLVRLQGRFRLDSATRIIASRDVIAIGKYLQEILQPAIGYSLALAEIAANNSLTNAILLTTTGNSEILGDESYHLQITPEGIVIRAAKPAGIFYALQTLRQLFPAVIESTQKIQGCGWSIPAVMIEDTPRFKWRGMLLDTARHIYPVEFIKRFIDLLALHKLNVFHWHLTDDQGWRIEIKKYPRLTEVGAYREASPLLAEPEELDGKPYGGFYTQEQIKDVVSYAADRFVTVVPEIDMPGHSLAALAGYPELGCSGGPYSVPSRWGVKKDVYCAGNEGVYIFLEDVLAEVLGLFPSQVIHIGGDEVPKDRWKQCSKCQALIKRQGLKDEDELQSYFVQRIGRFLKSRGRQLIGWDEILEGGLPPKAMVMSWRGLEGGVKAASAGHKVVMCPVSHCYFDYRQSWNKEDEPPAIGEEALLLEKVYAFSPIPEALLPQAAEHVLGAQGNVWTEYIPTSRQVEYMAYPRGTALAEVMWSSSNSHDFQNFMQRLKIFLGHLRVLGINYRDPFSQRKNEKVK